MVFGHVNGPLWVAYTRRWDGCVPQRMRPPLCWWAGCHTASVCRVLPRRWVLHASLRWMHSSISNSCALCVVPGGGGFGISCPAVPCGNSLSHMVDIVAYIPLFFTVWGLQFYLFLLISEHNSPNLYIQSVICIFFLPLLKLDLIFFPNRTLCCLANKGTKCDTSIVIFR